jgi:hypothetical protein
MITVSMDRNGTYFDFLNDETRAFNERDVSRWMHCYNRPDSDDFASSCDSVVFPVGELPERHQNMCCVIHQLSAHSSKSLSRCAETLPERSSGLSRAAVFLITHQQLVDGRSVSHDYNHSNDIEMTGIFLLHVGFR